MADTATAYRSRAAETSSGPRLIVALYERLTTDLHVALDALEVHGDLFVASESLVHAQQVLLVLRTSLDPDGFRGARELLDVYAFLERELIRANLAKDPVGVRGCLEVLEPLRAAWAGAVEAVERGLVPL
ncbi:MAG: flagellar protein FliS, partial [Actinomycetota bacterium]|nr:flagellar protein FliS [Actinomycetota bacterium]